MPTTPSTKDAAPALNPALTAYLQMTRTLVTAAATAAIITLTVPWLFVILRYDHPAGYTLL